MLVGTRFQVLFHSPPGVLFTFPSRYFSTIGHQVVFRLRWWSTYIPTGFHVSGGTLDTASLLRFSCTGLSPSMVDTSQRFPLTFTVHIAVRTPKIRRPQVWPTPRSLATTSGISVDVFSSSYLDVSVQTVPLVRLFYSPYDTEGLLQWVSPFGNLRVETYLQLTAAYRSLSRPSSAPDAKAFPLRPY